MAAFFTVTLNTESPVQMLKGNAMFIGEMGIKKLYHGTNLFYTRPASGVFYLRLTTGGN